MLKHAAHDAAIEMVQIILELQTELLAGLRNHSKRKAVFAGCFDACNLESSLGNRAAFLQGIVLEHHHALEQFLPSAHPTPACYLHQRTVLVLPHLHGLFLHSSDPFPHSGFSIDPHSHRQGVDEQPHHPLHSSHLRRSTRNCHPEHYVFLSAVPPHHQRPHSRYHTAQGHALSSRAPSQFLAQLLTHSALYLSILLPSVLSLPHGPRHLQPRHPTQSLQPLPPVPLGFALILLTQPRYILLVGMRRLQLHLLSSDFSPVDCKHLFDHYRCRPSVQEQMMMAADQLVALLPHLDDCHSHQGRFRQLKPRLSILIQIVPQSR